MNSTENNMIRGLKNFKTSKDGCAFSLSPAISTANQQQAYLKRTSKPFIDGPFIGFAGFPESNESIQIGRRQKTQSQPFNYAEPCRLTYAFGTVLTSNTDMVLTSLNANETTKPFNFAEPCKLTYGSTFGAVTDPSVYHKSNNVNSNGFGAVSDATGQSDYHKTGYAPSKTYTGPSLNTGTVLTSLNANEVEPSQQMRSHELRQLERDNFVELNSKYEKSYPRKRFAVRLFGPMLGKFKQRFAERKLEIAQIKDVHEIISADLEVDDFSKITTMKIVTDNYADNIKLLEPWPKNAFKGGVTAEPLPVEGLSVIITDVQNNILVDCNRKPFRDCERDYGLCNFERIPNRFGKPTKLLKAQAKTLFNLIDCMRYHIYIDGQRYKVEPSINRAKVCKNCGDIAHKACSARPRCLRCSSTEHTTEMCMEKPNCNNCKTKGYSDTTHRMDTDECPLLADKTKLLNSAMIEILLGEKIITNWMEILTCGEKLRKEVEESSHITSKADIVSEVARQFVNYKQEIDQKLNWCNKEIINIKSNQEGLAKDMNGVVNDVLTLKTEVTSLKTEVLEVKSDLTVVKKEISSIALKQDDNHLDNMKSHAQTTELINKLLNMRTYDGNVTINAANVVTVTAKSKNAKKQTKPTIEPK